MNARHRLHLQVARAKRKHFEMTGEKAVVNIDYDAIVKNLGVPNGDIEDFDIDHIVPLNYLLNGNPKMIEQAFHPSNLRWLPKSDNRKKSASINTTEEVEVFNSMQR